MTSRGKALADRFKAFHEELVAFVTDCPEEDWGKVCPGEQWPVMEKRSLLLCVAVLVILFSANVAVAIDTAGMSIASDRIFSRNGLKTKTECTEGQAVITLFPDPDGTRPPVDKVIDTLALVGKSFNQEFEASYFYKMDTYYDGRKWIETLAGNCRDSFQDNIISHCYYKVNF